MWHAGKSNLGKEHNSQQSLCPRIAEGNVQSKYCQYSAQRINELLWQEIPTAILILIRLQEVERIKTHQLWWQEVLNHMASSCCQRTCLPALLRSMVFWCDQNFTPKFYRLTSVPNCTLSHYKGKENDTVQTAHRHYNKSERPLFFFFLILTQNEHIYNNSRTHHLPNDMKPMHVYLNKAGDPSSKAKRPLFPESALGCRTISTLIIIHTLPFFINPRCKWWPLRWISGALGGSLKICLIPSSYCRVQTRSLPNIFLQL